ncbi:MAG: metal ABC transporter ATP-binding protein [Clostridia bacterium]|nr:metal ABC transporter ATP-binding protein [Clostridia bacterium]
MNILDVKDLSFSYPDKSILHRLSFSIEKGDFLCIIGTNGTGKSTLLKLILNIIQPTEGEIRILGTPSYKFKDYSKIAYVSQKATSFNRDFPATVKEIVQLGLYSQKGFLKKYTSSDNEKVISALKRVGMYEYKDKKIGHLSGGQQQRVFIAKALVSSPDIIFLDEPTVGIDIKAVDSICCLLGELNKSGITIVMVTHDISSILYHSNKVLLLSEDGKGELMSAYEFSSNTISNHVHHTH